MKKCSVTQPRDGYQWQVPIGTLLYRNEAVWEVVEYIKIKHNQLFLGEMTCVVLVCTACRLPDNKRIDIRDVDDLVQYTKWTPKLHNQLKVIDKACKKYHIEQDRLDKMLKG